MVAEAGLAAGGVFDRDHVEAEASAGQAVTPGDRGGEGHDFPLFGGGDVPFGGEMRVGGTGFDFDADDGVVGAQGDEIELAVAGAEVASQETVARFFEMTGGEAFTGPTAALVGTAGKADPGQERIEPCGPGTHSALGL